MITKSILAVTAVTASLMAFTPAPEAQAGVDIDIRIGAPGYGYGYPYFDRRYGRISCGTGRNIVSWRGFHKIRVVDCSLPNYKYTGWKNGHKYVVRVTGRGKVDNVHKIF